MHSRESPVLSSREYKNQYLIDIAIVWTFYDQVAVRAATLLLADQIFRMGVVTLYFSVISIRAFLSKIYCSYQIKVRKIFFLLFFSSRKMQKKLFLNIAR